MKIIFLAIIAIASVFSVLYLKQNNGDISLLHINDGIKDSSATDSANTKLYYPISKYKERLTVRKFGTKVTGDEPKNLPCGSAFSGWHNADDLEVNNEELNTDVPVYAAADGTVSQVGFVSGYGGLIVLSNPDINGQAVTTYYGHIQQKSAKVKKGENVKAGQQIAVLGQGCGPETDHERKHLHFGIRKGTSVVVRGYVQTEEELKNWLNPLELLEEQKAHQPE